MKQTSIQAWREVIPTLPARQKEVLRALRELGGMATMHEVGFRLMRPLHSISGRFGELQKKGLIQPVGVEKSPNWPGRTIWRVTAKEIEGGGC